MTLSEKVAHLKGFLEGMGFASDTNENKIILSMVDILNDMALEIETINNDIAEIDDYVDEIDTDLGDLEEYVYDDCDCDCDCCDGDDDVCEIECPNCGETVFIDDSIDPSKIKCPSCNKEFNAGE